MSASRELLIGLRRAPLLSTLSVLSIGFLTASLVPTARFAQPISAIVLYPMVALSGLFVPVEALPAAGLGAPIPLDEARPGDFVQASNTATTEAGPYPRRCRRAPRRRSGSASPGPSAGT